jgi:hypothetical protein
MKGYLVSCSVPKSKQKRQLLCLGCVDKLRMGKLKLSADAESVSLCNRGHGQQDALIFERQASGSWRQTLELTNELLEAVVIANESSVSRKRPKKAAVESALNRGMQAGSRAREMLVSATIFLIEPMKICNATSVAIDCAPPARFQWSHCLACAHAKRRSTRTDYMLLMEFLGARHPKGGIMRKIPAAILSCSFSSDCEQGVRLVSESGQEVCLKDLIGTCSMRNTSASQPKLPSS